MSTEKFLSTLDESEGIFENLSQNGLEGIAKWDALKTAKICPENNYQLFF